MRPAAGQFHPKFSLTDREYVQLIVAFRMVFPEVGIVLSTREDAQLRDSLFPLGITAASAGSHTEPGGYTGEGSDDLHLTLRGKRVELEPPSTGSKDCSRATEQFGIADTRTPVQVAEALSAMGLDPVWKDWDEAILSTARLASAAATIVAP